MRPTFLTFLCILTFFGSANYIYSGLNGYNNAESQIETFKQQFDTEFEKMQDQYANSAEGDQLEETFEAFKQGITPNNFKNFSIVLVISSLISIVGAVQMWSLKRQGYFIYLAGTAVGVLGPVFVFGGVLGWAFAIIFLFFGAIMSALYGAHLKYMD